ncbi:hypothetical protein [Marinobacter arenosus]|uniref:hypothetical protein n=1 Tax=Marinobacter arenosus TaxID=2856822 RepID=UPI001C4B99BE|nr:hypothetical protein [Marinobacter arenosus]MBW0149131.1 hypothetical protein [Marinobacter arenosus]
MICNNVSSFAVTSFSVRSIGPLPESPSKREVFNDELQPIGSYATINPYYRIVQDIEAVKNHEREDPEFKDKDWWWDHQRIRFLNEKMGLKVLLLLLPFSWILFLWLSGPLAISWFLGNLMETSSMPEPLVILLLIVGLGLSLGWIVLAIWLGPFATNWLMGPGMGFLMKPFEKAINRKLDQSFEDGCSEFNRTTGQVRFALGRKRFFEAPFVEFDAYVERVVQSGGIFYRLALVHRYTQKTFNQTWLSGIEATKNEVLAWWDMLQRYMDTSQPLPDVPRLEPFRHLDPVTLEYDRVEGRDPRYWRDLDLTAWEQDEGARLLQKQREYPWAQRQCRLTPQLGKVSMAEYREMRPSAAWPI